MIHINRFIDKIKATEANGNRSNHFPMTLQEARDLHADITKLLLHLNQIQTAKSATDDVIQIEIAGDKW